MSLTRKMLESMGIDADKVEAIIDAHTETVTALKEKAKENKDSADKLEQIQKDLDDANSKLEEYKGKEDFEKKYNEEHEAFEQFKTDTANKAKADAKAKAYRDLLKSQNVSEKRIDFIMKHTSLDELELLEDGNFKDEDKLVNTIKTEWDVFIPEVVGTQGAQTKTPPSTSGGTMTKADIYAKDDNGRYKYNSAQRQQLLADNNIQ